MLTCTAVWAFNEFMFPYYLKLMVDQIAISHPGKSSIWETFRVPILGIVITWTCMEIAMRIFGYLDSVILPKMKAHMRKDVFDYVKGQSLNYFLQNMSGSVGARIADIPKSSGHIIETAYWQLLGSGMAFVFAVIIMAQVSFLFSGITLLWFMMHMAITIYFLKEVNQKWADQYKSLARLNGETVDIITNATVMRLFARIPFESKRLGKYQSIEVSKLTTALLYLQKIDFVRGLLTAFFIFGITYALLFGWDRGWLTPGDFPLVALSSFNLIGLVWHTSKSLVDLFTDIGTLDGALSLLQSHHEIVDSPNSKNLKIQKGSLIYDHVNFGYRKSSSLFNDLSVTIKAGEKVGLVGFSGSGKTTFVNLLLREYDLNNGAIEIDGYNIAQVTLSSLREAIGVIPQDPSLFHRSILENIKYGNMNASDEDVIAAAKRAHCHEFIMQLEDGYQTIVGERGLRLSGGQRQRLAIARAILKNAPLLVLDEATSALDSATEAKIHESLEELMQGKTTIVVAHRLSTLKMMDRILVFDKGQIVEEGTQAQLLKSRGHFAHLWALQQEGFLPEREG